MPTESDYPPLTIRRWFLPALPPESRVFTINRGEVFARDLTDDDRIVAQVVDSNTIEVRVRIVPPPTKIRIDINLKDLPKGDE